MLHSTTMVIIRESLVLNFGSTFTIVSSYVCLGRYMFVFSLPSFIIMVHDPSFLLLETDELDVKADSKNMARTTDQNRLIKTAMTRSVMRRLYASDASTMLEHCINTMEERLTTKETMDRIPHLIFLILSHVPCFKKKIHPVERITARPEDPVNNAVATPTRNTLDKSRRALLKPTVAGESAETTTVA